MTNIKGKPTLVIKLKMATGTAAPGSSSPTLESKESTRYPSLFDTVIDVNVGPTQERFVIHKNLLCHHSSYFKAALEGGFEESETEVIDLRDEDPDVFWGFKEWLYSGAVTLKHYKVHHGTWSALLDLYVFAEKRIIPRFQNALIDAMINVCEENRTFPDTEIHLAWMNTATSSPLRTFLVDLYARGVPIAACFDQSTEKRECFDIDFVTRVAIALDDIVQEPEEHGTGFRSLRKDRCLWHVHGPEDPTCHDDSSHRP